MMVRMGQLKPFFRLKKAYVSAVAAGGTEQHHAAMTPARPIITLAEVIGVVVPRQQPTTSCSSSPACQASRILSSNPTQRALDGNHRESRVLSILIM